MAAVFPLDTSKPWTFNGVTYEYDATEDRWFVVSTNKTDLVDDSLETLNRDVDVLNTVIDQEIENRTNLLDAAASKNNQQDSAIGELDARVDALTVAAGSLQFKGVYTYVLEKTTEACTAAYAQCLLEAAGDVPAMSECNRLKDVCEAAITDPYPIGSFTSKGTTNVISNIEEFIITTVDANGQTIDWLNLSEEGDYLEFFESDDGDTALFEIVDEPGAFNAEQTIRVKFISQTGTGDGKFNLQTSYDVRVFKAAQGIDLSEADLRYVSKPYVVYFENNAANITPRHASGTLKNGELWYDTQNLQLFVWNNNAWVTATSPLSQDIVIAGALEDIQSLKAKPDITSSATAPANPKQGDLWFNPSTLKFAFFTEGAWVNPDQS